MIFFPNPDNNHPFYCKVNYAADVKIIMSIYQRRPLIKKSHSIPKILLFSVYYSLIHLTIIFLYDIIYFTLTRSTKEVVKTKNKNDQKTKFLSEQGVLNQHPERVKDSRFKENEFFDPRDLLQVKYEMIRKVTTEGKPVIQASQDFGFSRPSFYQAQSAFAKEGFPGLMPRKRGPRTRHKLTDEVIKFIKKVQEENASISPKDLVEQVQAHFGIKVHQRSIERAMGDKKKR